MPHDRQTFQEIQSSGQRWIANQRFFGLAFPGRGREIGFKGCPFATFPNQFGFVKTGAAGPIGSVELIGQRKVAQAESISGRREPKGIGVISMLFSRRNGDGDVRINAFWRESSPVA